MKSAKEIFVLLVPLILIGSLIYDYVKLYNEPTAVDNYTATGYFQKCDNNVIILDSCTVVYMGNTNFYNSYRIPKKQLDSTTLLQMSKSHTKMTILFRDNIKKTNRGLSRITVTKIIKVYDDKSIIYQYDYQGAIKDGIIMIAIIVFLSVLFYIWLLKDDKKKSNTDNNNASP